MAGIEEIVVAMLKERKLKISTAESCTGGMISSKIVSVSGASLVFEQGFVTYSNEAKVKLVGVSEDTVNRYGVVSAQTAEEMARGCATVAGADVGVAVTGVAGPGTEEGKPVGLVYVGCYYDGRTVVEECHFAGNRQAVRESAADYALDLVRRCLE